MTPSGALCVTDSANPKLYSARYKPYASTLTWTGTEPSFTWVGVLGNLRAAGVSYAEFSVRASFYSSTVAMWTRIDPSWIEENDASRSPLYFAYSSILDFRRQYVYVDGNPLTITDPTGLSGLRKPSPPSIVSGSADEPRYGTRGQCSGVENCLLVGGCSCSSPAGCISTGKRGKIRCCVGLDRDGSSHLVVAEVVICICRFPIGETTPYPVATGTWQKIESKKGKWQNA